MKKALLILHFFLMMATYGQNGRVGVNTSKPATSFDIAGMKDSSGNSLPTDMTGLQAPRLTRTELTAKGNTLYGALQTGALVYITDVSGGDTDGPRKNVASPGYYFFDGAAWQNILFSDGCTADSKKGIYNVKCFGAAGNNNTDDTAAIQSAINASGSTGGIVYFPPGEYKVTAAITISSSVILQGATPNTSLIIPYGSFDLFTFTGGSMGAGARDLHILGDNQTGGTCITVSNADRTGFENLIITNPYNAFNIFKANVCSISHCWVNAVKGEYGIKYWGYNSMNSDVLDLDNVQLSGRDGDSQSTGILIDGSIATVDIRHVACVAFGRGLWMKKTVAGASTPLFLQAYDLQVDYSYHENIRIDDGEEIFFTDLYAHGAQNSDGIYIGANVYDVHIQGGKITSHYKSGIYSDAKYVTIMNCGVFHNNISNGSGSGLHLGANSLGVTVSNNLFGYRLNYGAQRTAYGVTIESGASQVIITSNNITGNTLGSISGSPTNSVINNNIIQ